MGFTCSVCGGRHETPLRDIRAALPDSVFELDEDARAERATIGDDASILVDDHGELAYYVRTLLHLPIRDLDEDFRFGAWAEVGGRDYARLAALWHEERGYESPPFFGRLANELTGYDGTLGLPVAVQLRDVRVLPAAVVLDARHPLGRDQRVGIDEVAAQHLAELVLHR